MRRWLVSGLVLVVAAVLAAGVAQLPSALARVEAFRISEIRLEGNRFLTLEEAAKAVAISPMASVWDDFQLLEDRLQAHPLVEKARAKRRFPNALVLEVEETQPVALFPTPALEPVDALGRFLPIDPAQHRLDLPIIGLKGRGKGESITAAERRLVAGELARLGVGDPELVARISEITLDPRGDLRARLWRRGAQGEVWDLPLTLHFTPNLPDRRFREAMRVLEDAMIQFEGDVVAGLDLRFEDQVVVRLNKVRGN